MNNDGHDSTPPIPSSSEVLLNVRIDRICEEFEELLKSGQSPKIESYLAELPADHQGTLLEELLGLELDYRAKAGDSFTSEEYTLRFPEHASTVADLVVSVRRQKPNGSADNNSTPRQAPSKRASNSSQTTQRSQIPGGPVRIGPYEIIEPCGRGGMGVVYKAWHELFKQYRAIKVLPSNFNEDDISRFSMEIELAGRLNHPNIVRAHEANREQGILYLVMEFVDGINLDHLVKHHDRLPLGLACEMIRQAAEGLQHAHEHFLVHRDIKPSNLMVNQQGQIKILDFGLARLHAEQNASRLTKHGSVMGTLDFMAPEQWEDPMGATIQADIYSLGCTLYYLVTGTPPYGGENYSHWLKKQEAHRKLPVPRVDHEQGEMLQPIINRMMAKSRKERFQTPAEIVRALEPLSDPSELKRYAETPVPELSTSGISRTPIPTVNVSSTDLLATGILGRLADQFPPGDSEVNSKEKTLRPNQSRTDIDSDRPQPPAAEPKPPKVPWYRTRAWKSSLLVLAFVLVFAAWSALRPPQNVELAEQMGALPGLNGGWWFEEMPWYGPGVRKALMTALRNGETDLLGHPVEEFENRLLQADTVSLQADLEEITRSLRDRLSEKELLLADQMLLFGTQNVEDLEKLLEGNGITAEGPGSEELLAGYAATELHWLGSVLHRVSAEKSDFVNQTERVYRAAISAYDASDDVERALQAVAESDLSRFLADLRIYINSTPLMDYAAEAVPHASLFQISLRCELGDQYRRWEGYADKVERLFHGDPDSAEAWADRIELPETHPFRAEIRERLAWFYVDNWQMKNAIREFEAATEIRKANQADGSPFATRPILFNKQGQAMALHFLGQDDGDENTPGALKLYTELIAEIENGHLSDADEQQDRLPNIYERMADVYLYKGSYEEARNKLERAITEAELLGFQYSSTMWFYLNRLYYKMSLAVELAERDQVSSSSSSKTDWIGKAEDLERTFQDQMKGSLETKQQSVFDLEKKAALAIQAGSGNADGPKAWKDVLSSIGQTKPEKANRTNLEVLLLGIKLVFDSPYRFEDDGELNTLARRLLLSTKGPQKGDPQISTRYLKPVIDSAIADIHEFRNRRGGMISTGLQQTLDELTRVISPEAETGSGSSEK